MSRDFRDECIKKLPSNIKNKIVLPEIAREYTLMDVATSMSAGPARALGLKQKGNLGTGCDGDVVIYDQEDDPGEMFAHPRYVIKAGEVIIDDGEIREAPDGREYIAKPFYDPATNDFMRPLFEDCYTMQFENYPVEIERVHGATIHDCKTDQDS